MYNTLSLPLISKLNKIRKQNKHNRGFDFVSLVTRVCGGMNEGALGSVENGEYSNQMASLHHGLFVYDYFLNSKKIIHMFIETEDLEKFLANTKISDLSAISIALDRNGEMFGSGEDDFKIMNGVIHSPSNNHGAIAFSVTKLNDEEYPAIWASHNQEESAYSGIVDMDQGSKDKALCITINTFLYISAFPDCIKDGPPNNTPERYSGKSIRIKVSPEVISHHDGMTPHFRRGHFRLLSSERFTNKRGQIVFVRSSFVGGHAKTVLENSEVVT